MRLHLTLSPSFRLLGLLAATHIGALLCLLLADAPTWLKTAGSILCLLSAWHHIRQYALLVGPKAIIECSTLADNVWFLKDNQQKEYSSCLLGDSWRSRFFVILNFKSQQKRRISVLVLSDMLDKTQFRGLQVYLTLFQSRDRQEATTDAQVTLPDGRGSEKHAQ